MGAAPRRKSKTAFEAATAHKKGRRTTVLSVAVVPVQVLLTVGFGMAGFFKTTTPIETLAQSMPWVTDMPGAVVRFIGISELLGAIGLLLPLTLSLPAFLRSFTNLAPVGLSVIMVLAAAFHASRGEYGGIPVNVVLGGMAVFVAWANSRKAPRK